MLQIAVVDENPHDVVATGTCIEYFFDRFEKECYHIKEYDNGLDLIRSDDLYDIVFLDARLNRLDGIELAQHMRRKNEDTLLVFATDMEEYAIQGYKVDALDFIIKPVTQLKIDCALKKAIKRIPEKKLLPKQKPVSIELQMPSETVQVSSDEIRHIEVKDHILLFHTTVGEFKIYGRLTEMFRRLRGHPFVLCNRSNLVNLRFVSRMSNGRLEIDDTSIPIALARRKEVSLRFSQYFRED